MTDFRPAIAVAAASVLLTAAGVSQAELPRVKVQGGTLLGTATDGVASFKGTPFAAPPIGMLRWSAPRPANRAMGRTVTGYLVSFVKTGDPHGAGLSIWPPHAGEGGAMMDFAATGTAVAGPDPWAGAAPAPVASVPAPASDAGLQRPDVSASAPGSWIDPVTGHRIVRIDDTPGNYALYFNYNPFTPAGDRMIYLVPEGIRVVDLKTWATRTVLKAKVDRLLFAGPRSRSAYYTTRAAGVEDGGPFQVWRVDLDSGRTRKIADVPGGRIESINADETLLAGERELAAPPPDIAAQGKRDPKTGAPTYSGTGPDGKPLSFAAAKGQWMDKRLAARVPMEMYTVAIADGRRRTIHRATDWLNHVQFSPTDPSLLMFCHEGPWDKVDRIWTIRTDGKALTKVHTRTVAGEIAGHEFWSSDGHTIWYDLRTVRSFAWLASYDVKTGARTQLLQQPDQASYHFSLSPDRTVFSGDGGNAGKWISLLRPKLDRAPEAGLVTPGTLETERVASLATHDYTLEPNQHFTPDGKWLIYRTNMEGAPAIYAVEVGRAERP